MLFRSCRKMPLNLEICLLFCGPAEKQNSQTGATPLPLPGQEGQSQGVTHAPAAPITPVPASAGGLQSLENGSSAEGTLQEKAWE